MIDDLKKKKKELKEKEDFWRGELKK